MQSETNSFVIAAAGARKTTLLVEEALSLGGAPVLITTYTTENVAQISQYFIERNGCVPGNVTILPWITFMLREGAKPYQAFMCPGTQIKSVNFDEEEVRKKRFVKKENTGQYYLDNRNNILCRHLSDFVCRANASSGGMMVDRLERIYDYLFIDEVQDMAGYDLDLIEILLNSKLNVTCVGDPRQATYSTNNSPKNKQYKKDVLEWAKKLEEKGICTITTRNECYRCIQSICNFSDSLFPHLTATRSVNRAVTGHDGMFFVRNDQVERYAELFRPQALRYQRTVDTGSIAALNIGITKGKSFDRVLIFPTAPMKKYLKTSIIAEAGDISKLYVAVTRARYSVAFVMTKSEITSCSKSLNIETWRP